MGDLSATDVAITIAEKPYTKYQSVLVERDIGAPDHATFELSGVHPSELAIGAAVSISIEKTPVFVGEVVEIRTTYGAEEQQKTTLIAMNRFHRLSRGRKSHTFEEGLKEEDIVKKIAEEDGLEVDWGSGNPKVTHGIVLWTNQSPMEFLRTRAERYGFDVWCVGNTLHCSVPDLSQDSGFELKLGLLKAQGKKIPLASFVPRMSSLGITKSVSVTGSHPKEGKVISGEKTNDTKSPLGDRHATKACGELGGKQTCIVDLPVGSAQEAEAIATGQFLRQSLQFITADAELSPGSPELQLGTTVKVTVDNGQDPFNGGYYVRGITHRHVVKPGKGFHYVTQLRLARDALSKSGPRSVEV